MWSDGRGPRRKTSTGVLPLTPGRQEKEKKKQDEGETRNEENKY